MTRWVLLAVSLLGLALGLFYITRMTGHSHSGPLPPLTEAQRQLRGRLERHVKALAGEIGERHLWRPEALAAAAAYIERTLADMGYAVVSQTYVTHGRSVRNLEAELEGTVPEGGIVVIGAHYDTVPGSPGANDNASGVAALLELARLAKGSRPARTLRFVAFVNEEPPLFYTKVMGSRVYARRARERGENIVAMISLETIGYYTEAPGSQGYPIPFFHLFYPSRGDFLAFVGNIASRDLVRRSIAAFRRHAAFPSEGVAAPGWVGGVHWSDHWSFWQEGYPAIMVTDTALFRYPHYHAASDTPDRLDFDGLARVVAGLGAVVADLAGTDPPDPNVARQPGG
ncbi:MAG TPA: M28 family peptidase [Methylococcus sp.]|nr:M28 family peptidase [Methylococcus sp.]